MLVRGLHVIGFAEGLPDIRSVQLAPEAIGHALDMGAEIRLHLLGQLEALVLFQHPGKAAFSALRIDADDRFVAAAQIGRVDWEVRHAPALVVLFRAGAEAFLDGILMATRKRGVDQLAAIGMPRMDRQFVAIFDRADHPVDIREIERGIDALRVHVEGHRNEAAIARPLAVSEQAAFDSVCPCHQRQFRRRDAGSAIVMGVQRDDRAIAIGQVADEIFDLIGVDIGRRRFHCGGQVQDDRMLGRGCEHVHH